MHTLPVKLKDFHRFGKPSFSLKFDTVPDDGKYMAVENWRLFIHEVKRN